VRMAESLSPRSPSDPVHSIRIPTEQGHVQASLKNEVTLRIMFAGSRTLLEAAMADNEAKRESGASLMFIGLAVWVVDLLVIFFLPAGMKLGHRTTFVGIIVGLGVAGLILLMTGYLKRGRASEE